MGRMSVYDIPPKPKVWAGSPNECWTFGSAECCVLGFNNVFYWWAHWAAGNVVVNKHVSMHASSEMGNYIEQLQRIVYEQK